MKNEYLLEKALKLLPKLSETRVFPVRSVELQEGSDEKTGLKETLPFQKRMLRKGDWVILDFGNHEVGYLTLKLEKEGSHCDAPVWLRIHFAENPKELTERADGYQGWICSSWIEEEQVHVDMVPGELKLPRRYAFRYAKIEVMDISSKFSLRIADAFCTAVSSADDSRLLPYQSSVPCQKQLDAIACRTLHNCMQTVFEDGPKRDRRLWIGDLRIQALANYETYRQNDMVKACLYLFGALPMEDGRIGACLFLDPEPEVDDTVMFDYSLFFVSILLSYFEETEDAEALEDLYSVAQNQIDLALEKVTEDGLVMDSDRMGWCFADWNLALNRQAAAQGILLYSLMAAEKLADFRKDLERTAFLKTQYDKCRKAADRYLWDSDKKCYISGKDRQISVASQVWLILGGAIGGKEGAELLFRVRENPEALRMVTPYMVHNYIDALILCGEKEKALSELSSYWGGMAKEGADTFWELYDPQNPEESPYGGTIVNSYCHAWSCGPAYFLRKYYD